MSDVPRPWWRIDRLDVIVVLVLAAIIAYVHWPSPPAGPIQVLRQGTVAGTGWSILAQRAGPHDACLQVRVAGARRALMCDQHWDRDVHRLWHGAVPETAGDAIGRPSLLLVRFPDTDQVLVVSVLYREITTLHGTDGPTLHTTPLFDIGLCYVAGVLTAAEAGALQAFGAHDEPLFYNYVARGPVR